MLWLLGGKIGHREGKRQDDQALVSLIPGLRRVSPMSLANKVNTRWSPTFVVAGGPRPALDIQKCEHAWQRAPRRASPNVRFILSALPFARRAPTTLDSRFNSAALPTHRSQPFHFTLHLSRRPQRTPDGPRVRNERDHRARNGERSAVQPTVAAVSFKDRDTILDRGATTDNLANVCRDSWVSSSIVRADAKIAIRWVALMCQRDVSACGPLMLLRGRPLKFGNEPMALVEVR